MRAKLPVRVVFCLLLLSAAAANPKDKGQNAKGKPGHESNDPRTAQVSVVFSKNDRAIIGGWMRDQSSLPPGLAKKGQLPPGLQKHLVRNGTLPPGLEKKLQPLPVELERKLPPLPPDYRRAAIQGSVVIMNRNSRVIADVIVP